jgi:hypothetical protein
MKNLWASIDILVIVALAIVLLITQTSTYRSLFIFL